MIKIATRQRYATRIVVFLAGWTTGGPASKKTIASAEAIPVDYVEQICVRLRAAGIVASHRGKRGGFTLACDPRQLTVADVLKAVDGEIDLAPCSERPCPRAGTCPTQGVWDKASRALRGVFSGVTVAELAQRQRDLSEAKSPTFEI